MSVAVRPKIILVGAPAHTRVVKAANAGASIGSNAGVQIDEHAAASGGEFGQRVSQLRAATRP